MISFAASKAMHQIMIGGGWWRTSFNILRRGIHRHRCADPIIYFRQLAAIPIILLSRSRSHISSMPSSHGRMATDGDTKQIFTIYGGYVRRRSLKINTHGIMKSLARALAIPHGVHRFRREMFDLSACL